MGWARIQRLEQRPLRRAKPFAGTQVGEVHGDDVAQHDEDDLQVPDDR
jgi:hypothetical protein